MFEVRSYTFLCILCMNLPKRRTFVRGRGILSRGVREKVYDIEAVWMHLRVYPNLGQTHRSAHTAIKSYDVLNHTIGSLKMSPSGMLELIVPSRIKKKTQQNAGSPNFLCLTY